MAPPPSPSFQLLFEQSPSANLVLLPDPDFTIVAVSDTYLRATHTRREDLLGRPLFEAFPDNPQDPSATGVRNLRASLERARATRAPDVMAVQKYDIRRPGGRGDDTFETRYWSPTNTPVLSSTGEVLYLIHRVEDVTGLVRATQVEGQTASMERELLRQGQALKSANSALEEAVRARDQSMQRLALSTAEAERQRAWLHSLFMQAPTAIAIFRGPEFRVELANPLVCSLWGRTQADVVGKPLFEALPEARGQGFMEMLQRVLQTGEPVVGRAVPARLARLPGGALEEVHFDFVYAPLREQLESVGPVEAIVVVASEVTDQVRARRRLEELTAERMRTAEERLRLATEAMELGIWELDLATNELIWDERTRLLFGVGADDPVSLDSFRAQIHPDDRPVLERRFQQAMGPEDGTPYAFDLRILPRGQALRWVFLRGRVHRDAAGNPVRFLGTVLDITDRKRAEEETARTSAILNAIIQSIPDALYVGDATGIKQANAAALEMLGFDSLEELNQSVAMLGERLQNRSVEDGHRLSPEEEPFMRAVRGEVATAEVLSRNVRDGREIIVRCAAAPIRVGEEIIGAVAINTDVTQRRRTEEELREAAEFRERFIGIVSHDLRNPLSAISLAANAMLRSEELPPRHLRAVRRIVSSAERMQRMIADLLDFTRGRLGGGIPVQRQPSNLRAIVEHVVEELEGGNPDRELRLTVTGRSFSGNFDPDRLAQLIGNLGKNAIDYSPEGSRVDFLLREKEQSHCIEVHNEGPEIPPELVPVLFEPFKRAAEQHGSGAGLGLGLYIVREIARAHGGSVDVRSDATNGTTFSVCLPRRE